jgi:hypothetical protein
MKPVPTTHHDRNSGDARAMLRAALHVRPSITLTVIVITHTILLGVASG